MTRLPLLLAVLLLAGCTAQSTAGPGPVASGDRRCCGFPAPTTTTAPPEPTAAPPSPGPVPALPAWDAVGKCGIERWQVKTGTDAAVNTVNPVPFDTTVAALDALPGPVGLTIDAPRLPNETRTYRVKATLTAFKRESDSDVHLILADLVNPAQTLTAEIPHPDCVTGGPWKAQIAAARAAFDTLVGKPPPTYGFGHSTATVTVTGVAFSDVPHGQAGEGPQDLELHPVTALN